MVLPLVVVEELDRHKGRMDEAGANARRAIRLLEEQGASRPGGLRRPIGLPSGGTLRIEPIGVASSPPPEIFDPRIPNHRLLSTCLSLTDEGIDTVLVTRDAALRIKAAQLGVTVQDYRADTVAVDESYSGVAEVAVGPEVIDRIYAGGKAALPSAPVLLNQFVVLKAAASQSALGQVIEMEPEPLVVRVPGLRHAFGIESKTWARPSPSTCC